MSKILFAMTHVLTTQGWFQPTQLLPQLDLQPDEADNLVEQKKAAYCEHDSPLAKRVHELSANCPDKLLAIDQLRHAVEQLSAVSPGDEPIVVEEETKPVESETNTGQGENPGSQVDGSSESTKA